MSARFVAALAVVTTFCTYARGDDLPSPLPLAHVLERVRAKNPQLAEKKKLAAAAAIRPRLIQPPDPMLMLEWWQQPVDFSMVPIMLTLKQPLPILGTLKQRRELARREAAASSDEANEIEQRTVGEARRAYFELALAESSLAI